MHLYLLRHGEVTSHRGDVPITPEAERHARAVGAWFGGRERGSIRLLSGETRRAMDTSTQIAIGIADVGGTVHGPDVAMALRNPDLYVSGVRVNMVSSAEALAAQVPGLTPENVADLEFFPEFFASPDRIGWWLGHESPPGETSDDLALRMRAFIASLWDHTNLHSDIVVAVTHSPLLRAVGLERLGRDIGEPPWVSGLVLSGNDANALDVDVFDPELA